MLKKPAYMIVLLMIASVLIVTGCGGSSGSAGSSDTPDSEGGNNQQDTVTIRFAWWGSDPRHQATLEAINAYMDQNPNIRIEAEYMGFDGYSKKLATQFAGNNAPDVFQYVNSFNDQLGDFLLDLNATAIDTSNFPESALANYATFNNRLTFIPAGQDALGTIFNETFFEQYGIPADTEFTWDSILEIGRQVHAQDSSAYLMSADIDVIEKLIIIPYITQKTGKTWVNDDYTPNFTEADLEEAYTYLLELYEQGVLEPFGDSTAFVGKMDQNPRWVNGQIGMLLDYAGAFDKYAQAVSDANVSIAPFPIHEQALQSANPISAGMGFAINQETAVPEEAAKFVDWLVNDEEAAIILNTHRGIPASSRALEALSNSGQLNPVIKQAIEYAGEHESLPLTPLSDNASLRIVHEETIEKVIYDRLTPEEAAGEAMANMLKRLEGLKAEAN